MVFGRVGRSFADAKRFERRLDKMRSPGQRLSDVQICRLQYSKIRGLDESGKGLRRVLKVVKQAQG
jgi:hypothetical protein